MGRTGSSTAFILESPGRTGVDHTAVRTHRLVVPAPSHRAEQLEGLVLAQRERLPQRQGSGVGREQEVGLVHRGLPPGGDDSSLPPAAAQIVSPRPSR